VELIRKLQRVYWQGKNASTGMPMAPKYSIFVPGRWRLISGCLFRANSFRASFFPQAPEVVRDGAANHLLVISFSFSIGEQVNLSRRVTTYFAHIMQEGSAVWSCNAVFSFLLGNCSRRRCHKGNSKRDDDLLISLEG